MVPLGSDTWTINPNNTNQQKLSFYPENKQIRLSALKASSGSQSIALSGMYKSSDAFDVELDVQNLIIENILPSPPTFAMGGNANLEISIMRSTEENQLGIDANINSLKINGEGLGDLFLEARGNTQINNYFANLEVTKSDQKTVGLRGFWQGLEDPILNFNLNFDELDLAFLSPLGKKALNQIRGKVAGDVTLWGGFKKFKTRGKFAMDQGRFCYTISQFGL